MLTERENMEICWNHEQPEWVPMINTAAQMIITPEVNDRPLFMSGKDHFGLEWELDPAHPELMTHVKPGCEMFDDIEDWEDFIKFPDFKDKDWEAARMRTKAMPPTALWRRSRTASLKTASSATTSRSKPPWAR